MNYAQKQQSNTDRTPAGASLELVLKFVETEVARLCAAEFAQNTQVRQSARA